MTRDPKTPTKAIGGAASKKAAANASGRDGAADADPDSSDPRQLIVHIVRGQDDGEAASPHWLSATWDRAGLMLEALIEQAADAVANRPDMRADGKFAPLATGTTAGGPALTGAALLGAADAGDRAVPRPRAEAAIALSHDAEVAVLNHMFRGIDKATNVLSFPAPPVRRPARLSKTALPPDQRIFLGDIALSEETILREAAELGIPPHHHLQHLVVHGLLHLLHLDHDTDDNAARMERLETAILATIGVPDPYAGSDPVVETGRDTTP